MAYIPYSPETGCMYTLTGPNGVVATFNNIADANHVGMITDISGLDSAGVRENGDSLVEQDGGWHNNFYYDRRAITISGTSYNYVDATTRTSMIDRLRQATNAMSADATLSWTNNATGSVPMFTNVRRQQPPRITGAWIKTFQIALVAAAAPLYSVTQHTLTGTPITCENKGDYPAYPTITVVGASTNPITITNTTTGSYVRYNSALSAGHTLIIDTLNHAATDNGVDVSGSLDFVNSTWAPMPKGNNTFTLTGGGTLTVAWRDTWI